MEVYTLILLDRFHLHEVGQRCADDWVLGSVHFIKYVIGQGCIGPIVAGGVVLSVWSLIGI